MKKFLIALLITLQFYFCIADVCKTPTDADFCRKTFCCDGTGNCGDYDSECQTYGTKHC